MVEKEDSMRIMIWQNRLRRLREGKHIQEHDILMLRHERLEYELMKKEHMNYQEAHKLAEKKYNYQEALNKFKQENNL